MKKYDVVIVGAGHNGLVCACYLAKAGMKVAVVERQPFVGGAAVSREVWPGYKVSVASYWMSLLQPKIMSDLGLKEHGVEVIAVPPSFHPFEDGRSIVHWSDEDRMAREFGQFAAGDAEAYNAFSAHMAEVIPHVRRLLFETPVDPSTGRIKDLSKAVALAWRMRDVGPKLYDIWDLLTLSAHEYLKRWFKSDQALTAFGSYASGAAGLTSPMTPGSAYVLARPLMRDNSTAMGGSGLIRGGMGTISEALVRVALENGVEVITGAPVKKVCIDRGKATGILLESGETIAANIVVSNAGAKITYLNLIGEQNLESDVVGRIKRHRTQSIAFKINLATDALPNWSAWNGRETGNAVPGSVTLAENSQELEDAFHSALEGRMAARPYLWITTPSAFDDTIAPPGRHIVQIMGGHVPYTLKEGPWDDSARRKLLDIVVAQICRYAPGFDANVLQAQVLTPPDIEAMFAMVDGHVHHGEMSLDQVFFRRPAAHLADYRTPIENMYICGAAAHPGGGVTGVPGHNAAREILADAHKSFPSARKRI